MRILLAVAAIGAALLAGCSTPAPGPTLLDCPDNVCTIHLSSGNMFAPANAKVPLGATVKWVDDGGVHDITDADHNPPQWSSDQDLGHKMQPGETFSHTFPTAGTFHYECGIHASTGMKGTLVVG